MSEEVRRKENIKYKILNVECKMQNKVTSNKSPVTS